MTRWSPRAARRNIFHRAMGKTFLIALLGLVSAAAAAETPEQFAERMQPVAGVQTVLNHRNDGSFGSLSIGIQPEVVQNRSALDPVLADIGKFAAGGRMKVSVLSPTQPDADYIATRLRETGVKNVATRVMAAGVSIQVTRVFLTADSGAPPAAAKPGKVEASKSANPSPGQKEK